MVGRGQPCVSCGAVGPRDVPEEERDALMTDRATFDPVARHDVADQEDDDHGAERKSQHGEGGRVGALDRVATAGVGDENGEQPDDDSPDENGPPGIEPAEDRATPATPARHLSPGSSEARAEEHQCPAGNREPGGDAVRGARQFEQEHDREPQR